MRCAVFVGAFASAFAFQVDAAVQSQTFTVDLSRSPAQLLPFDNSVVTRCFGSSHASTAMRADWQRELTQVQKDLGTEYVRFHGLLNDDMSAVVRARHVKADAPSGTKNKTCTFVPDQDLSDPGGGVFNASSEDECCQLCYSQPTGLPEPCVAAVFAHGKCYFKLGASLPRANKGVSSCVTDRPSPSTSDVAYSFTNIFTVFDFLRSINMRPVVEVSFMPSLLAEDTTHTVFWYKGLLSPPKRFAQWRDFMTALGRALVDRYGAAEVRKWYFEVWNEPNCCGGYPDTGCCGPGCGNQSMYLDLYTHTYRGLKAADPLLRVGGPATAQLAWIPAFVAGAAAAGCPPDFVSRSRPSL
jgi:hypothetical protein